MMHSVFSSLLIVNLVKDASVLSSCLTVDKNVFSLILIFPMVFILITSCFFPSLSSNGLKSYMTFYLILLTFLIFCFSSSTPLIFLLSLEMCVFVMIMIIFNFSKDKDKFSSVSFMFIINSLGSIPFMFFSNLMSGTALSSDLVFSSISSIWVFFSFYLILISKVPVFFFHFWLTKAHVSASGSGSMILASLMLKIGTLGIYKFCFQFLHFSKKIAFPLFLSVGLMGCIMFSLVMMRFFDLKYLVACSSVVHMSMIFPCLLVPSVFPVAGSLMMMVGHGLISCFIFFLVTLIYELSLNRSADSGKGVESSGSATSMMLYIFFLLNLGFPPFISFLSEFSFVSFFLKTSYFFLTIFSSSLMILGMVFMIVVLMILFGKNSQKWSGYLDQVTFSCFFYFILYFSSIVLFFN